MKPQATFDCLLNGNIGDNKNLLYQSRYFLFRCLILGLLEIRQNIVTKHNSWLFKGFYQEKWTWWNFLPPLRLSPYKIINF